jgi:hypothetical protein
MMTRFDLYFGRNKTFNDVTTPITNEDFDTFVRAVITPRFAGFTLTEGVGYWYGQQERSTIMTVFVDGSPRNVERLNEIRSSYCAWFHQESVLLVQTDGCAVDFGQAILPSPPAVPKGYHVASK